MSSPIILQHLKNCSVFVKTRTLWRRTTVGDQKLTDQKLTHLWKILEIQKNIWHIRVTSYKAFIIKDSWEILFTRVISWETPANNKFGRRSIMMKSLKPFIMNQGHAPNDISRAWSFQMTHLFVFTICNILYVEYFLIHQKNPSKTHTSLWILWNLKFVSFWSDTVPKYLMSKCSNEKVQSVQCYR